MSICKNNENRVRKIIEVKVTYDPPRIVKSYGNEMIYYGPGPELNPSSTPDNIIKQINTIVEEYGKEYMDLNFKDLRDCGCYHDCACSSSYHLYGKRFENDLEYEYRIKQEAARAAERRDRELAEYERLKKKFEDN